MCGNIIGASLYRSILTCLLPMQPIEWDTSLLNNVASYVYGSHLMEMQMRAYANACIHQYLSFIT